MPVRSGAGAAMNAVAAVATFGVPERDVDSLIEALLDARVGPARWLVFGMDMALLGALDLQWRDVCEVVIGRMPSTDLAARDAVLTIIENEGLSVDSVIWLHGRDAKCNPPVGVLAAIHLSSSDLGETCKRVSELCCRSC